MAWSRTAYRLVHQDLADGTATVVIAGEVDLTATPALARHLEQILARGPRRLVIDLTLVSFIDVAAARVISEATRSLPVAGPPVLRGPSPAVRRVLALTGFDALCEFE
jgi:anti-sigma B factor antagonist